MHFDAIHEMISIILICDECVCVFFFVCLQCESIFYSYEIRESIHFGLCALAAFRNIE